MDRELGFENTVVRIQGGGFFRPLKDSAQRWWVWSQSGYEAAGVHVHALYHLKNGEFIRVLSECCFKRWVVVNEKTGSQERMWVGDSPPTGRRVSQREALDFLISTNKEIPESLEACLQEVAAEEMSPPAEPPPRPLEFWQSHVELGFSVAQVAHEVDPGQLANEIAMLAIDAVQDLRQAQARGNDHYFDLKFLKARLFSQFRVSPKHWWGDRNIIPPAEVDLLDLPWPVRLTTVKELLGDIRDLLRAPFAVLAAMEVPLGNDLYPDANEQIQATRALIATLPDLESLVVQLRQEIEAAGQAESQAPKEGPPVAEQPKPPTPKAVRVYRIWETTGASQEEVASLYKKYAKQPMTQGQVSRLLAEVMKWKSAGNPLPEPEPLPTPKVQTVDPKLIDMGANQDHLTPRQRPKPKDK